MVLNLSDFLETPAKEQVFPLQKCQDKGALICLSISSGNTKTEEVKYSDQNFEDLIRQLNDAKNKHSSLKNDYDELLVEHDHQKSELLTLKQELQAIKSNSSESLQSQK